MAHRLTSVQTVALRKAMHKQSVLGITSRQNHIRFVSSRTSPYIPICDQDTDQKRKRHGGNAWENPRATHISHGSVHHKQFPYATPYLNPSSVGYYQLDRVFVRNFHTVSLLYKEQSLAEKSIKAIKDQAKQTEKAASEEATATTEEATTTKTLDELKVKETVIFQKTLDKVEESAKVAPKPEAAPPAVVVKKTIGQRIVAEIKHYYHGFRLLFMDVKVCMRYVRYVLNGRSLTRRERRQFVRTAADLFRLVPFSVFIIVPFMEFLLPVALKLFPNMLPSTFAEASKEQEKLRSRLKVKLEMAKFLQDTIEETALTKKGTKGESASKFAAFLEEIRTSGSETKVEEIVKYSKLFEDEITLDTLSHQQLMALCRLLEIPMPNLGTSNFLRFQLRLKLRELKNDDKMIQKEGIDSLALWELQEACRARGMRALGVPVGRLKTQLQQWLRLHLEENIPTSLLLLSRALYLPEQMSTEEQLKQIIVELPPTAAEEAKVKISEVSGERVDNKTKLDVLKQEEAAIKAERAAAAKAKQDDIAKKAAQEEVVAKKAAQEEEEAKAKEADVEAIIQKASTPAEPSIVDSAPELKPDPAEVMVDKATEIKDAKEEPAVAAAQAAKEEEEEISSEDLEQVEDIIEQVAEEKKIALEKKSFKALKEDVEEYKEAVSELKAVVLATGGEDITESTSSKLLSSKVDKMMNEMEKAMEKLFEDKQQLIEDIEVNEVRVKRNPDLQEDKEAREEVLDEISEKKAELISINELMLSMRKIQKAPDDAKLQRIFQVLDEDKDGQIDVTDALKVIELLGKDNMKLTSKQVADILVAIRHEELIEKEEKEQKRLEKLAEAQFKQEQEVLMDIGPTLQDNAEAMDVGADTKAADDAKSGTKAAESDTKSDSQSPPPPPPQSATGQQKEASQKQ